MFIPKPNTQKISYQNPKPKNFLSETSASGYNSYEKKFGRYDAHFSTHNLIIYLSKKNVKFFFFYFKRYLHPRISVKLRVKISPNFPFVTKVKLTSPMTDPSPSAALSLWQKHEACNRGRLDMVELLLKHNANINALGYQNNTPLHEATLNKQTECVRFENNFNGE